MRLRNLILLALTATFNACTTVQIFSIAGDRDPNQVGYVEHLTTKIEIIGASRYPHFHDLITTTTTLDIEIEIGNGGRLVQTHIIHSSNNPALDAAMLDIIHYSAPYPPFPDEMKLNSLKIQKRWQFSPE